ncbi:MAG: Asp-tRNA(Asn)/Glu-tRNA(Gln) amidotransferase subunit GatC [Gaiellales bacterium]|nr:MAG: Asp-tRNA(Asn)/Glu-tRNA(Gln) amidotransferase subunit GatC [Gaiellales bacterium]
MISHEDVRYVARLARLNIEEDELDRYVSQLTSIISHIDKIAELELEDVEPTTHVVRLSNVMRDDEVRPSVSREAALLNGPEVESGAFRVPPIIEG